MNDRVELTGMLDDTLKELGKEIERRNKEGINSRVLEFTRVIGESPGVLGEVELTRYSNEFSKLMKRGEYIHG
jgi:hypothetical protein